MPRVFSRQKTCTRQACKCSICYVQPMNIMLHSPIVQHSPVTCCQTFSSSLGMNSGQQSVGVTAKFSLGMPCISTHESLRPTKRSETAVFGRLPMRLLGGQSEAHLIQNLPAIVVVGWAAGHGRPVLPATATQCQW